MKKQNTILYIIPSIIIGISLAIIVFILFRPANVVSTYTEPYILLNNQTVYGYTSEEIFTDSTPFTTAYQTEVRQGIIANNCTLYGTTVEVKGKIYTVEDRMNSRYDCSTWDIWFSTRSEAITWGKQILTIKLYE